MAASEGSIETMRRSTRLRLEIPVRLRSSDPKLPFDILTKTLMVNAQGCGLQTKVEIPPGTPVEVAIEERVASGHVLNSTLADEGQNIWVVGVQLDRSGNFWGIDPPPADWVAEAPPVPDARKHVVAIAPGKPHPFAKQAAPKKASQGTKPTGSSAAEPSPAPPAGLPAANVEELRSRFDALLEEFGDRLRTQVSADWEQWRTDATATLREIQSELGKQLAADAGHWREETQKSAAALAGLLKSSDDRARIAEEQAKQIAAAAAAAKSEIAGAIDKLQRAASDAEGAGGKAGVEAQSVREEIARLKAELGDTASKAAAQTVDSVNRQVEEKLSSAVESGVRQLQARLQEMSGTADADLRRRLLADFEERQEKLLATAAARLEEVKSRETSFRSSADELQSQLSRQAEQAMAGLRTQVGELIARHEADLASRLSARHDDMTGQITGEGERLRSLQAAAEKALQAMDDRQQAVAKKQDEIARAAEAALESIDGHRAAAQKALDKAASDSLEKLNAGVEASQQQLESRLQQQAWDYEAQAEASSARLQARIAAALQKLETDIEQKRTAMSANLAAEAGKVADEVRASLHDQRQRHDADLAAESERRAGVFRERIDQELRQRDAEFQARQKEVAASMAALEARHQQIAAELAGLQESKAHLESLLAALPETVRDQARQQASEAWDNLRAQADKHISDTVKAETQSGAARVLDEITASARQLREDMAAHAQQTAVHLQAQLAEVLAERQQQVTGLAERLEGVQSGAEAKSQALQKQLDDAQKWLGEHTAEFQRTVHDAFLQAGGEIRGRVHAAVDSADEMIRQKSKDAMAGVESASAQHAQALARQAEEAQAQMAVVQRSATESAEALLKSRLAETLDLFREDASRLAESAIARWQSAMDDTLRSIPDLLRHKLEAGDKATGG